MQRFKLPLLAFTLIVITFLAFSPILSANFTNWDDQIMVTQNAKITSLSWPHIVTFFTTFHERLYHPLVLISYAVDYRISGLNPIVFHATSLFLHLISTILVMWLFFALSGSALVAFVTAALFGFHPMHVESVAWISERKDVLYTTFFIASLISYVYYVKENIRWKYWLCFLLFILSLLSKSMAIMLPFILVLIDIFLSRNIDKEAFVEKIPFFVISFMFGILSVLGHYETGVKGREFSFSLLSNVQAVFENLLFYIIKFFAPFKLSCLYPMPRELGNIPAWLFILSPVLIIAILVIAWHFGKRAKTVIFGSLFFILTILPVSQILPVGLKVPADRYTYVPYIGLFFIFASLIEYGIDNSKNNIQKYSVIALLIFILVSSWSLAFQRVKVWQNSYKLWENTIENYKHPTAYYNLAEEYFLSKWQLDTAIVYFSKAIEVKPDYVEAWVNRGLIYYYKNNFKQALYNYGEAEKLDPKLAEIYLNRGNSLGQLGRYQEALNDYDKALILKSSYPEGWYNRGNLYMRLGRSDEAISDFTMALKLKENYPDAYNNRGNAYFAKGENNKAFTDFSRAILLAPNYGNAYFNRALIYLKKGHYQEALSDALMARSLGVYVNEKAIEDLKKAIK